MIHPKERLAIYNRIKSIGRRHETFTIITFISRENYYGKHYTDDFKEVINSMVSKGQVIQIDKHGSEYPDYRLVDRR